MRRRPNLWIRTDELEQRRPKHERWRTNWNLDALSVDDLEALMPLSEKHAAHGDAVVWSAEEMALMERLWIKATAGTDLVG
jgi:hypothetical protein